MAVWKLKKGEALAFRGAGHPWIFKGDLEKSPFGLSPGHPVILQDEKGQFLAYGYGNPHSNIVFRALIRQDFNKIPVNSMTFVLERVLAAWKHRDEFGFSYSFRLCFAEADGLPGLIIDRYTYSIENERYQVFVLQISTAGMEVLLPDPETWLKELALQAFQKGFSLIDARHSQGVLRRDMAVRKKEGLQVHEEALFFHLQEGSLVIEKEQLNHLPIQIPRATIKGDYFEFDVDLIHGQKTGFFLDQSDNIESVCHLVLNSKFLKKKKTFRILDLCCYVGQWSAQLVGALMGRVCADDKADDEVNIEVDLVDVSKDALMRAKTNVESAWQKSKCIGLKGELKRELNGEPSKKVFKENLRIKTHHVDIFDWISKSKSDLSHLGGVHDHECNHNHDHDRDRDRAYDYDYDIVIVDPPALIKNAKDRSVGMSAYSRLNAWAIRKIRSGLLISCSCSGLLKEEEFRELLLKALLKNDRLSTSRMILRGRQPVDHPQLLNFPEGNYLKMFVHHLSEL